MDKKRALKWLLVFACWTLVGLMFASQWYFGNNANGYPTTWANAVTWALTEYWVWAALTPLILVAGRPFFIDRDNWRPGVTAHLLLGLAFASAFLLLYAAAEQFTTWAHHPGKPMSFSTSAWYGFTKKFHMALLIYWVITGVSHAFEFYRRSRQSELRAAQLETQLSRAQLHALKMQLHPHFLFNTLNTISALVHRDPRAADRMVARLGDLLRLTLDNQGVEEVSLKEELEFTQKYLEIEQTRFYDRLTVEYDIDPASLDARLPNLLLQPLVENAIKHGISARPGAGRIEISARRRAGSLDLRVRDDGNGLAASGCADRMNGAGATGVTNNANGSSGMNNANGALVTDGNGAFVADGNGALVAGVAGGANGGNGASGGECSRVGVGLANTRARLAQLYGDAQSFELANAAGGGCCVSISIPFRTDGAPADARADRSARKAGGRESHAAGLGL